MAAPAFLPSAVNHLLLRGKDKENLRTKQVHNGS